jgi:4-hydroxybenzoate polyprenyltransferase
MSNTDHNKTREGTQELANSKKLSNTVAHLLTIRQLLGSLPVFGVVCIAHLLTIRELLGSLPCFGVVCIAHLLTIRELLGSLPVFGVVCIAHLLTIRQLLGSLPTQELANSKKISNTDHTKHRE